MTSDVFLELGGYRFKLQWPLGVRAFEPTYLPFIFPASALASSAEVDAEIEIIAASIEERWLGPWVSGGDVVDPFILDNGSTWGLASAAGEGSPWCFHFGPSGTSTMEPPAFHVLANRDFTRLRVYLGEAAHQRIEGSHIFPLDQVVMHHFAAYHGGLVVHASGVRIGERGYLFSGDSGAGKSTIATLFEERLGSGRIFSDDRIIVRHGDDGWMMYGTPWHGTFPRILPQGIPLGGICFLEQARTNELKALSLDDRLMRLIPTCLSAWWLPEAAKRQFDTLEELTQDESLGFHRFSFLPDASAVDCFLNTSQGVFR